MKILNYCAGYDTGGQSIRYKQAFDRHSPHQYRSCVVRRSYLDYPTDARPWEADSLAAWADIIHCNGRLPGFTNRKGKMNRVGYGKPAVVHYHGTAFRDNPYPYLHKQRRRGAVGLVSTIDLELIAPDDLEWMPAAYNLDWLWGFRDPQDSPVLRIGHSPTARPIKSTKHLMAAVVRLSRDIDCKLVLVERRPWLECLKVKGTVDVFFDQVLLGYGNNAIEAWGMGLPVIAGAADDTLAAMKRRFGQIPFYTATEDTIYEALVMLANPVTRAYWASVGANHVRKWHDDGNVVTRLTDVYTRVLEHSR